MPTASSKTLAIDWDFEYSKAQDYPKVLGKLVVRAWLDPAFDKMFRANPAQVMRDNGIPIPQELSITYEQLQIPSRPTDITDEQLMGRTAAPRAGVPVPALAIKSISCAGSASSFSCPGCTASCFGSGGCAE